MYSSFSSARSSASSSSTVSAPTAIPPTRRRQQGRDPIDGITLPAIRRLARRGGVKRISGLVYEHTRQQILKPFLESVLRDAVTFTEHARRKTVTPMDVVNALRRQNMTFYGAGPQEPALPAPKKKKTQAPSIQSSSSQSSSASSASSSRSSANRRPPSSPRDPYFGSIAQLEQDIKNANPAVTKVKVWNAQQALDNVEEWFHATEIIRDTKRNIAGCPRLELPQMKQSLESHMDDPSYRMYNVYGTPHQSAEQTNGLLAFLILYKLESSVYIDFACALEHSHVVLPFINKLKASGQPLFLDAIIETPLRGLIFWWKRGFRTNNADIDGYLSRTLDLPQNEGNPKPKDPVKAVLAKLQRAKGFNYKKQFVKNNDLLRMMYPPETPDV